MISLLRSVLLALVILVVSVPSGIGGAAPSGTPQLKVWQDSVHLSDAEIADLEQAITPILNPVVQHLDMVIFDHNNELLFYSFRAFLAAHPDLKGENGTLRSGQLVLAVGLDPTRTDIFCAPDVCDVLGLSGRRGQRINWRALDNLGGKNSEGEYDYVTALTSFVNDVNNPQIGKVPVSHRIGRAAILTLTILLLVGLLLWWIVRLLTVRRFFKTLCTRTHEIDQQVAKLEQLQDTSRRLEVEIDSQFIERLLRHTAQMMADQRLQQVWQSRWYPSFTKYLIELRRNLDFLAKLTANLDCQVAFAQHDLQAWQLQVSQINSFLERLAATPMELDLLVQISVLQEDAELLASGGSEQQYVHLVEQVIDLVQVINKRKLPQRRLIGLPEVISEQWFVGLPWLQRPVTEVC